MMEVMPQPPEAGAGAEAEAGEGAGAEVEVDVDVAKAVHGKVVGVIIPPPEIRSIVDKTAEFVAKNGKSFEEKILNSKDGKTSKFNFMKIHDPYHAYYELKIREFEDGKPVPVPTAPVQPVEPAEPQPQQGPSQQTMQSKASMKSSLSQFVGMKPSGPPPELLFSSGHPTTLSTLDADVIKLTAQYTALNGREFLSRLAQQESRNPQFDFLKPTHMLFSYFTTLVDDYARILLGTTAAKTKEALRENLKPAVVLQRIVHRWEWQHDEEEKKRSKEAEENREKDAFHAIDWHDFVVVEQIDFDENEFFDAAPAPNKTEDMDMEMDEEAPKPAIKANPKHAHAPPPPPALLHQPPPPPPPPMMEQEEEPMEEEEELKVVADSSYKPRMAHTQVHRPSTMIDPISGKAVPVEQMGEHMRIQLMDPKWREENQRFLDKQKETSYAEGESILSSLKQFAKRRGDIFDQRQEEEELEERKRKRVAETTAVMWDGQPSSANIVQRKTNPNPPPSNPPSAPVVGPAPPAAVPLPPPPPAQPTHTPIHTPIHTPMQTPTHAPTHTPHIPPQPAPTPVQPMAPPMGMGMNLGPYNPNPAMYPTPGMHGPYNANPNMYPQHAPQHTFPPPAAPPVPEKKSDGAGPIPEDHFISAYGGKPITIMVQVPNDPSNPGWQLNGQTLHVPLSSGVTSSVKDLKDALSAILNDMPANKQQLRATGGFLKDSNTLAFYNLNDGAVLEMVVRSRGGRR